MPNSNVETKLKKHLNDTGPKLMREYGLLGDIREFLSYHDAFFVLAERSSYKDLEKFNTLDRNPFSKFIPRIEYHHSFEQAEKRANRILKTVGESATLDQIVEIIASNFRKDHTRLIQNLKAATLYPAILKEIENFVVDISFWYFIGGTRWQLKLKK